MIFFVQWMCIHILALSIAYPLAHYSVRFFRSQEVRLPFLANIERKVFSYAGLSFQSMTWLQYLNALLGFQLLGFIVFYALARLEILTGYGLPADKAFQLAASFLTNTDWLNEAGERSWSFYLWIFGVIVQNFLSAGTGFCVMLVMARCFLPVREEGLGCFYLDLWRICMYVLLPLSLLLGLLLVSQGVPQNLKRNLNTQSMETKHRSFIVQGPMAAQMAIRNLGSNGGGYTHVNAAHPLETPTPLAGVLQMVSMLLIPVMACFMFGLITGSSKRGWVLWSVMFFLATIFAVSAYYTEHLSLFGKEFRFGNEMSVIWHALATATATGSVNATPDWFQSLTTGSFLFLINLGEIAFGGVGIGVVNMLFVFIMAAFLMNLLVGSSPTFLSKALPLNAIKIAMFYLIFCPCIILMLFSALVYSGFFGHIDAHHVCALWYALSSIIHNNGSAYLGLNLDSVALNYVTGVAMLLGRFGPIILTLTFAGILDSQKIIEESKQGFILESRLFCTVSVVMIFILTILAFLPLWSFGPLAGAV